jgi:para-aminobenzoate synthetase component 1
MEIIADLEPVARGPYCGALGYLGFGADMDTSVSIRVAVASGGRVVFHAGGAVVADSDPEAEYVETLDKARGLMSSVGDAVR